MQRASAGAQALACFIASRFKRVIPDGLGHDSTCPPSLLNPLTLAEILDVVAILGMAERDANITLMRKLDWPVDCSRGLQKFERAAGALSNWPHGFYARLRALRLYQPWVDSSWEVTKSLDPFIRIATLNLLPGASALILDAVAAFASDGREWNEHRHRVASEGLAWQA